MSKINDLIKELCPNGVKYKKLEELVDYIQPTKYIVKSTDYNCQYDIPVLTAGQSFILGYTNELEGVYCASKDKPVIIFDDFTTSNHWVDFKFKVKSSAMKILIPKTSDIFKYIYYCISNICYIPKEHSRQWIKTFSQFAIPIPPLEVQEEIVRILDKFGELEARKSQYEFWRGKIWKINNYKQIKLKELCDIGDGLHGTPQYVAKGEYYFINGNNLKNGIISFDEKTKMVLESDYSNQNIKLGNNSILMSINGTIGKVSYYNGEPIMLGKSVAYFNIKDESKILKEYLFYFLQSPVAEKYYKDSLTGTTILNLGLTSLREFKISLPDIVVQKEIVNILDKFDKLINDISVGLPAEIEARKRQYEYYRNKLLSFEEVSCE